MRAIKRSALALGVCLAALQLAPIAPLSAQEVAVERPMSDAPYWDASLPVEQRVEDLLSRMTLEEKVAQIITVWDGKGEIQGEGDVFDPAKASARYPDGIGQIARPSDRLGPSSPRVVPRRSIEDSVQYVIDAQKWAMEQTRLGIPILFHEESLHGFAAKDATSFPQSIGLASTWDPDLVREINALIAGEVRARGVHLVLSPVVDVARDPRWGRIEETFGEDPFLVGEMGVASVEGLSGIGTDKKLAPGKVLATLKHMTGHGQPESGTNVGPAQISERTLREMFFPPFEQVVKRTPIEAVMASYNEIDGIPSHSSKWLLTDVLRGEWGYQGAVVSDYYAIEDLARLHKIVPDMKAAGEIALLAGVDVDLPQGAGFAFLVDSVKDGSVPMAAIDNAARRFLTMKFNSGLFDDPWPNLAEALRSNGPEGVALARKAAEKSLVLLKNDGVLPLALPAAGKSKPTIAVIGPNADVARLGGYYGEPRATVTPLQGIRDVVGDKATIVYSKGVEITVGDDWWEDAAELADPAENRRMIAAAVEAARGADTILLFIGDTEKTSREGWAPGHLGDRTSLDLVGEQNELFLALKALGKPIVAVLVNGRPPSYPIIAEQADAILETWYAGEQQGNAIADALFGRVNPGGKMPVSTARNEGQLPNFYNYKPSARRGYLFDEVTPLFPFGFGLSYTTFDIGTPTLSAATIKPGEGVTVRVTVSNTGKMAGDEVVQVYLRDEISSVTRPVKELVGFKRVTLKPGESRAVDIAVRPEAFMLWNREMQRVVEPGEFTIMVGPNSQDVVETKLTVSP
ncbi:glycoside hydrolase family 3 C-terminal domain-containing protein [Erythrobacter sp. SDW2]|uniref:glycoside hydrolase family 3 N-terminal domain-containing protein n=1 Tax=Erythrobacter sp. SDW2 TaxID=2907154 RepID=UPI001F265E20|nr:glycoside hydrolase family 3 N-terminal domain-containing protein [Erythrobacter sp. SDW2]UIP06071.1 glycoside hydrolase family 3 C-terminal domain-containing protein [Erythrobacter sp. SDW2]